MITENVLLEWESGFSTKEKVNTGSPPYEGYAGSPAGALYLCIQEIRGQRDMLESLGETVGKLLREREVLMKNIGKVEEHNKAFAKAEKDRVIGKRVDLRKAQDAIKELRKKEAKQVKRNSKSVIPAKDPYRKD